MKLIIRQYLSMLKERNELDELLPDLLLNMNIPPISRAQIGVRQDGVDIAAIGADPVDGLKKLFLFTIKAGNITRSSWDAPKQGVRPSLNEIIDTYISTKIRKKDANLPIKIVLCCNGNLLQEIETAWVSFTKRESRNNIEFEFWGGDLLSKHIEDYFLSEYLFPENLRKGFRKTLALVDDPDYDLSDYYSFIDETLQLTLKPKSKFSYNKVVKAIRQINLSLRILHHWAKDNGTLKPPLLASERSLLSVYDFIRKNELFDKRKIVKEYSHLLLTYVRVSGEYFEKLKPLLSIRDSFYGYAGDEYNYQIRTFEQLGILATIGLCYIHFGSSLKQNGFLIAGQEIAIGIINLINTNPSCSTPVYDNHANDIGLVLLLLFQTANHQNAINWIDTLLTNFVLGYRFNTFFPISSDNFYDLIELKENATNIKEELSIISTLLPMLFQWILIYKDETTYKAHRKEFLATLSHMNLQLWYPDDQSDTLFYKKNAAFDTGATFHSIKLPEDFEEFRKETLEAHKADESFNQVSAIQKETGILFIACRHFRTPLIPWCWQGLINEG